jgi:hypothetical protein
VVEQHDAAVVARGRAERAVADDPVERRQDRLAGVEEDVDAEVERAALARQLGLVSVGVVDAAVLEVAAERGCGVGRLRVLAGPVIDGRVVQRRVADGAGVGRLQVGADRPRVRNRLVAAGAAQPQVLELRRHRAEPAQQRGDRLLADEQVVVRGLLAALERRHRDAHRQPRPDQVGQQLQLLGRERRDLVVAGDER